MPATATRPRRSKPAKPQPPPADLVEVAISRPLAEFAIRSWRSFFQRESLHINDERRRDLRPVELLIGTLGEQLTGSPTVLAVDHNGREIRCYPIVGTAMWWLKAANWCLAEAWRKDNTREARSQHATLGLVIVSAISPEMLRGRGEEVIEDADGWSES